VPRFWPLWVGSVSAVVVEQTDPEPSQRARAQGEGSGVRVLYRYGRNQPKRGPKPAPEDLMLGLVTFEPGTLTFPFS
jgi:hypothetical protein